MPLLNQKIKAIFSPFQSIGNKSKALKGIFPSKVPRQGAKRISHRRRRGIVTKHPVPLLPKAERQAPKKDLSFKASAVGLGL